MFGFVHPLATAAKFRVLYVGNDLKFIASFRKAVSEHVYRLVAGSDYEIILFLRSAIPYDLLLLDNDWSGNEGLKLAQLAHSQPHRKRMPIVLLSTASLAEETKTLAKQERVVECALKTANLGELLSRVIPAAD